MPENKHLKTLIKTTPTKIHVPPKRDIFTKAITVKTIFNTNHCHYSPPKINTPSKLNSLNS